MSPRDQHDPHRVATPLELLFDLVFVVAVSQASINLHHMIADDHVGEGVVAYIMVFFAIWWAWMNFTWFASAYDNDDAWYRLTTLVQMAGVLVLAAGVPDAFGSERFVTVTIGYAIMRLAMVTQWLRAAANDPAGRAVALRYAAGIALVQVFWLSRLALPEGSVQIASFVVLVVAELAVPILAERPLSTGPAFLTHAAVGTSWHPHHIAERYGLFTIIVLGEGILANAQALQEAISDGGWTADAAMTSAGGLALLFGIWWIYYLEQAGQGLEQRRNLSFVWGYGHYFIFAALAALGAAFEVAAQTVTPRPNPGALSVGTFSDTPAPQTLTLKDAVEQGTIPGIASPHLVAFAVAVPVCVCLAMIWALHAPLRARATGSPSTTGNVLPATPTGGPSTVSTGLRMGAVIVSILAVAGFVGHGLSLPIAFVLMALPPATLIAIGSRNPTSRPSA